MALPVRVVIVLPADLEFPRVGGIHSFVEGFVKFAPDDFEVAHVGVARSGSGRRVGEWSSMQLAGKPLEVFPVVTVTDEHGRGRFPLSLRFTVALARHRNDIAGKAAVLQFHRPGTSLPLLRSSNRKVQVIHLTSAQLLSRASESQWRRLGRALPWLETVVLPRMDQVAVVSEEGTDHYRRRFPRQSATIAFLPNWVDDTIFRPLAEDERLLARSELRAAVGASPADRVMLFAARFEEQKDPRLAIDAVSALRDPSLRLVMVGEGTLRPRLEALLRQCSLGANVRLLAPVSRSQLARLMNAADALLISSAHETGPTVAYEALACGLPVVSTNVGRVSRLLTSGGGRIAAERSAQAVADQVRAILVDDTLALRHLALKASEPYRARTVLEPFYELHRRLLSSSDVPQPG